MITGWFLGLGMIVAGGLISWLMPQFDASQIDKGAISGFVSLVNNVGGVGDWFPWATGFACVGVSAAVYFACLVIRTVRVALGHVPVVGGNG